MANRNMAAVPPTEVDDVIDTHDDVPPTYEGDDIPDDSSGPTLDDLTGGSVQSKRDEEEYQRLNPPVGDWVKDEKWDVRLFIREEDTDSSDYGLTVKKPYQGRTFLSFIGKPHSRVDTNGFEYKPTFVLRISPDKRVKQDDATKADSAYKLYLRAKNLFLEKNGRKMKDNELGALISMLKDDEYVLRTMNGDNGPLVVDIKSKRQARS